MAGLRAAVELADHGEVLVVTKEAVAESNTHYAQGGIAVAMEGDEDVALHLKDTVAAGDGLVYRPAAEVLVSEGPLRVQELIEWGAKFDREGGALVRTREAAHSLPRILHANGDATGAEISRSLVAFARAHERIRFAEWTTLSRLIVNDFLILGADLRDRDNCVTRICAGCVLIATGGAGQVYSETTNPAVATGDGIALAWEQGVEMVDMEFYQFHPTAFSLAGAPRFLLSEALRGEGAYLRNDRGERFMECYHPLLELAPRDVVARAIAREGMGERPDDTRLVHLDMRHVRGVDLYKRFPGISAFLAKYRLDLHRDLIPVRPAAHYLMGGIRTDLNGRTSVSGLYAAGEAACTGVHGANRLASNSLLEGLVFGARAAKAMLEYSLGTDAESEVEKAQVWTEATRLMAQAETKATRQMDRADEALLDGFVQNLQRSMWISAGLMRSADLISQGYRVYRESKRGVERFVQEGKTSRSLAQAQALCCVADLILYSASNRGESRGAHFRTDYPRRDDVHFQKHFVSWCDGEGQPRGIFEEW